MKHEALAKNELKFAIGNAIDSLELRVSSWERAIKQLNSRIEELKKPNCPATLIYDAAIQDIHNVLNNINIIDLAKTGARLHVAMAENDYIN